MRAFVRIVGIGGTFLMLALPTWAAGTGPWTGTGTRADEGSDAGAAAFAALCEELASSEPVMPAEKGDEAFAAYRKEHDAWSRRKIDALQAFIADFPDERAGYRARLVLADTLMANRQVGPAGRVLRQVLAAEDQPDLVAEAKVMTGDIYMATDPERALTLFEEALATGVSKELTAKALTRMAGLYQAKGEAAKARTCYERIVSEFGEDPVAEAAKDALWVIEIQEKGLLEPGRKPIAFDEKAIDGRRFSPEAYAGKVVLIDFWATWCGPCVAELPNVKDAYEKYHDDGFEILGVSLDSDGSALETFLAKNEMPWAQFFDGQGWGNRLAKKYGIRAIPATFLVGRDGVLRYRDLRGDELRKRVEELVAEKAPSK